MNQLQFYQILSSFTEPMLIKARVSEIYITPDDRDALFRLSELFGFKRGGEPDYIYLAGEAELFTILSLSGNIKSFERISHIPNSEFYVESLFSLIRQPSH